MRTATACAALLLCTALPSTAAPPLKLTGTYSSLRFGTEDLTGVEVSLVIGGDSYYAIVQCAEGVPGVPEVVPVQVNGAQITFRLENSKSGCPTGLFSGSIDSNGLTGAFEGTKWPGFMKRGKSYRQ